MPIFKYVGTIKKQKNTQYLFFSIYINNSRSFCLCARLLLCRFERAFVPVKRSFVREYLRLGNQVGGRPIDTDADVDAVPTLLGLGLPNRRYKQLMFFCVWNLS